MTVAPTHALVRTNEKGIRGLFRCIQCDREDLPAEAALWPCSNPKGKTQKDSLLEVLQGKETQ